MDEPESIFMSITGCENSDTAKFFLESSENNLEQAVDMYMESGGGMIGPFGIKGTQSTLDTTIGEDQNDIDQPATTDKPADPDEQRWYTGGGVGSGQEVIAPRSGADKVKGFLDAIQPHARQGMVEDLEQKQGAFSGAARTLDGQIRKAREPVKKVVVKFYDNEIFTVDDGPPRRLSDPGSMQFLDSIRRQECPAELRDGREEVEVSVMQAGKDWEPCEHKRPAFEGTGRRLGDGPSTANAAPSASQPLEVWKGPDDSKPVASIQLRFPDGTRLIGRFNHDQLVSEIRSFVAAARPHDKNAYVMMTGFPHSQLQDESQTIAEAGLLNTVVTFKCV